MSTNVELVSSARCFQSSINVYSHDSEELQCKMKFGVILPDQAKESKLPVLYWLSGLTCTEQNFLTKSAAHKAACDNGVIIVCPDTSPRGCNVEGEEDSWDFGTGAGFYLDATEEKWKKHYRMYSYIVKEFPKIISANFPVIPGKQSIFGHSMGGHGAITIALKNPGMFKSLSAFSPISNPINGPWGKKAFTGYLGPNQESWRCYDATELAKNYDGDEIELLVDQGAADPYLKDELLLPNFCNACNNNKKVKLTYREHVGYDHGFYFIATFIEDHIKYHARYLK
ncbi:uncharacterized protein TRIADDRAFT_20067 [Trichoplax adhaerens]|uniref:S-formylglutathione hydrolase n=1 Tax=Trichoplax adhaerens TaxID=10228 RepID=B3RKR2_TRIAD|nr:hypothetical protein TRIADDRAFT_20067 [Trichoplax adhaerens]EDV28624.1 hypothetical protein TRIADDRAFT_20067 [Trichoplax adhaerens]|eukprot:XP_002107826.1 hypothetical protein TRIADDRAFT_20067 [Trichoplax adhaerens]